MINIIQTVNYGCDIIKIHNWLEFAKAHELHGIRFNLCRFSTKELDIFTDIMCDVMEEYADYFEFCLDIPYPYNKVRLINNTVHDNAIIEGERYRLMPETVVNLDINDLVLSCKKFKEEEIGETLYYADGEGSFSVEKVTENEIIVYANNSFNLWDGKSINCGLINDTGDFSFYLERLSKRHLDRKIVLFLSFVKKPEEVELLRKKIDNDRFILVSKIESVNSKQDLSNIIAKSDGILLARGDMAIYMSQFDPLKVCRQIQKEIQGKRFFGATDILINLEKSMLPTRAEMMDFFLLKELGCTDIVLPNYISNPQRFYNYIKDNEKKNWM